MKDFFLFLLFYYIPLSTPRQKVLVSKNKVYKMTTVGRTSLGLSVSVFAQLEFYMIETSNHSDYSADGCTVQLS